MASFTLTGVNDLWADGTSVSAYEVNGLGNRASSATATGTVSENALTFSGLAGSTRYQAYASSKQRSFLTDAEEPTVDTSPSWTPLLEPGVGGHMTGLIVSPRAPERVLVAGDMFGVAYSNDAGASWNAASGVPTYEMGNFTWHPAKPQEVWVGSMGGPLKSSDGGQSWTVKRAGMPATDSGKYTAPCDWIRSEERRIG